MLRGVEGVALLRKKGGLWLLGEDSVSFLIIFHGPNSVGAGITWHLCDFWMAPCNWLGERHYRGISAAV
jgi:hypothetical protein